jgi:hypothetical protein
MNSHRDDERRMKGHPQIHMRNATDRTLKIHYESDHWKVHPSSVEEAKLGSVMEAP